MIDAGGRRNGFQALDRFQPAARPPPPGDLRRHIVRNAVDPRAQRAAAVKLREAAPEVQVDLLEQVAPCLGIGFVCPREPSSALPKRSAASR